MQSVRSLLIALVLTATVLAGCIGGDGTPAPASGDDGADEAAPTADTGSIKGQVVTKGLEEVAKALVAVVGSDGSIVTDTMTDQSGHYTFNGLAPGQYKVQVSSTCCKAALQSVDVKANAVAEANFQLDRLTAADLNAPYIEENEWNGFISCGARAGVPDVRAVGIALCAVPGVVDESVEDPNDDFIHYFNISKGLKTVVIGMDWQPVGGISGGKLSIDFEEGICEEVACADAYTYAAADGGPPFVLRVDLEDITEPEASWENIQTEEEFKFRIFAGTDYANLVYQQPFTVYWYEFYNEPAAEDFSPLPDE